MRSRSSRRDQSNPRHRLLSCIALAALVLPQQATPGPDTQASAELAAVATAYATFDALDATGWVRSEVTDKDGVTKPLLFGERDFNVFFTTPGLLLFSMVHRGSEEYRPWAYMLSLDGANATVAGAGTPEVRAETTTAALSGSYGVTSGAATMFAGLLLPDIHSGHRLADMSDARVAGEETVRGVPCLRIVGKCSGRDSTYWVSRKAHLVWRAAFEYTSESGLCRHMLELTSMHARKKGSERMEDMLAAEAER